MRQGKADCLRTEQKIPGTFHQARDGSVEVATKANKNQRFGLVHSMKHQKAKVYKKLDAAWHEIHFGVVINHNDWGTQVLDPDLDLSPIMWHFAEWFPHQSKVVKTQLI